MFSKIEKLENFEVKDFEGLVDDLSYENNGYCKVGFFEDGTHCILGQNEIDKDVLFYMGFAGTNNFEYDVAGMMEDLEDEMTDDDKENYRICDKVIIEDGLREEIDEALQNEIQEESIKELKQKQEEEIMENYMF